MNYWYEIDIHEADAMIKRAIKLGVNLTPLTQGWAAVMRNLTHQGFHQSRSPEGVPWAPLKTRQGKPLRNTGRLLASITTRYDDRQAVIGTNLSAPGGASIAAVHQFGAVIKAKNAPYLVFPTPRGWVRTKQVTIPARPFFPRGPVLPTSWAQPIVSTTEKRLGAAFK